MSYIHVHRSSIDTFHPCPPFYNHVHVYTSTASCVALSYVHLSFLLCCTAAYLHTCDVTLKTASYSCMSDSFVQSNHPHALAHQVSPPGTFKVTEWGREHLYGATFSNTFASRKALLSAAPDAIGTATSGPVAIPRAGTWYVCVRYEAAYRFETEFQLTVKQGSPKLTKMYGQRSSPKIWPFGTSTHVP